MASNVFLISTVINFIVFSYLIILLLKKYLDTRIPDYIYFSVFFFFINLGSIFALVNSYHNELIFYQCRHISANIAYLGLLRHIYGITNHRANRLFSKLLTSWIIILILSILFWKPEVSVTSEIIFNITIFPDYNAINFPQAAGTMIFGLIHYSSAFVWPATLAWSTIYVGIIINYIRVDQLIYSSKVDLIKLLWISSFTIFLIWLLPISIPIIMFRFTPILVIISTLIIAAIPILLPEGFLISRNQIENLLSLYERFEKDEQIKANSNEKVIDYLNLIDKS